MPRHASRSLVIWSGVLLVALAAHDLSHALDGGLETPLDQLAFVAVPQWLVLAAVMTVIAYPPFAKGGARRDVAIRQSRRFQRDLDWLGSLWRR